MSEQKPREFWIKSMDIPRPGSFNITGALVSGDNPEDGEVLFIEKSYADALASELSSVKAELAEAKALMDAFCFVAHAYEFGDSGQRIEQLRREFAVFLSRANDRASKQNEGDV